MSTGKQLTPTTDEMDGILTEEDRTNRYTVVFQCRKCKKWTPHKNWIPWNANKYIQCKNCGAVDYDRGSIKSLRTYNPLTDNKRRPK